MKAEEYAWMAALEKDFWWYRGMRAITRSFTRRPLAAGPKRLLDAGCGTGFNLADLQQWVPVSLAVGLDLSAEAFRWKGRQLSLPVQADVIRLPFRRRSFDLISSFDVLYTLPSADEVESALREFHAALSPGGWLLLRVPAFPFLYGSHDRAVGGQQRFRRKPLCRQVSAAGLQVRRVTYVNSLLFPAAILKRLFYRHMRATESSEVRPVPRWLDRLLHAFLVWEAFLLRWDAMRFPFGLSLLLLARKPPEADK